MAPAAATALAAAPKETWCMRNGALGIEAFDIGTTVAGCFQRLRQLIAQFLSLDGQVVAFVLQEVFAIPDQAFQIAPDSL